MKKIVLFLTLTLFLPLHSISANDNFIDKDYIIKISKQLTGEMDIDIDGKTFRIHGRGSYKERDTQKFLVHEFKKLGYSTTIQIFPDLRAERPYKVSGKNVIAENPNASGNKTIIVSAHLDAHFNGANDNASGIAVMLGIAKALAKRVPFVNIKFVAFDKEEVGLDGSRYYVRNTSFSDFEGNLNMDMVGFPLFPKKLFLRHCNYPPSRKFFKSFFRAMNEIVMKGKTGFKIETFCKGGGSDHASFWKKGLPAIGVSSFLFKNIDEEDPCNHTPCDKFSRLDMEYMSIISGLLAKTLLNYY